ncbi:unnamed protein product [Sympodiomycopsis kandeliae]
MEAPSRKLCPRHASLGGPEIMSTNPATAPLITDSDDDDDLPHIVFRTAGDGSKKDPIALNSDPNDEPRIATVKHEKGRSATPRKPLKVRCDQNKTPRAKSTEVGKVQSTAHHEISHNKSSLIQADAEPQHGSIDPVAIESSSHHAALPSDESGLVPTQHASNSSPEQASTSQPAAQPEANGAPSTAHLGETTSADRSTSEESFRTPENKTPTPTSEDAVPAAGAPESVVMAVDPPNTGAIQDSAIASTSTSTTTTGDTANADTALLGIHPAIARWLRKLLNEVKNASDFLGKKDGPHASEPNMDPVFAVYGQELVKLIAPEAFIHHGGPQFGPYGLPKKPLAEALNIMASRLSLGPTRIIAAPIPGAGPGKYHIEQVRRLNSLLTSFNESTRTSVAKMIRSSANTLWPEASREFLVPHATSSSARTRGAALPLPNPSLAWSGNGTLPSTTSASPSSSNTLPPLPASSGSGMPGDYPFANPAGMDYTNLPAASSSSAHLVATTEGMDSLSMAEMFSSDKEAVAEMANLKPCSKEALDDLKKNGLRTELKYHQSSGLKYLVDAEHRQLPKAVKDDDECLWFVRPTHNGGTRLVNRAEPALKKPVLPRGCVLADAMGLGKTLTILALILSPPDGGQIVDADRREVPPGLAEPPSSSNGSADLVNNQSKKRAASADQKPSNRPAKKAIKSSRFVDSDDEQDAMIWGSDNDNADELQQTADADTTVGDATPLYPTLIVCPMSVISNWMQQADTHTDKPKMRYAVLHGQDAEKLKHERNWSKYNFIVTTYDWIRHAYKDIAMFEWAKLRQEDEDLRLEQLHRMEEHQAHIYKGERQLQSIRQERAELEEDMKTSFLVCPRSGGKSKLDKAQECKDRASQLGERPAKMESYTQEELHWIWTGQKKKRLMEWKRVFEVDWLRVVLDEAHVIRNQTTLSYKAIKALQAERRVAVTGTPIINSTLDFCALVSWIGVQPFNTEEARKRWTKLVETPVRAQDRRALAVLQSLTKSLVILRTKEMKVDGRPLVELPPLTTHRYEVEMKPDDAAFYLLCEEKLRHRLLHWAENNEMDGKQGCILVLLQRMRQLANDRRLVPDDLLEQIERAELPVGKGPDKSHDLAPEEIKALQDVLAASIENEEDCPICYDALSNSEDDGKAVILHCGHCYHMKCIQKSLELLLKCPYDQQPLARNTRLIELPPPPEEPKTPDGPTDENAQQFTEGQDSAKLDALAEIVATIKAAHPQDKVLIFSNFVCLLRLIEKRMKTDGVSFATFYGCHNKAQREATLRSFNRPMPAAQPIRQAQSGALYLPSRSSILDALDDMSALGASPARQETTFNFKGKGKEKRIDDDKDPVPQVCLMSMGAGSVGLNLTVANHVILVDPWWNEPLSAQAINRTHRIGQTKPVTVHRLVSKKTVEHRVVEIAEQKMELTIYALSSVKYKGHTLFKGHEAGSARKIDELGILFGMSEAEIARFRAAYRRNHPLRR